MKAVSERMLFLRWLLINVLFILIVIGAHLNYHGAIHKITYAIIALILAVYSSASLYCGYLAWKEELRGLGHINLAIEVLPMLGMVGTVTGFLLAFGSDLGDVQARILGASTGLLSTLLAVSCTIVLIVQRHLLNKHEK